MIWYLGMGDGRSATDTFCFISLSKLMRMKTNYNVNDYMMMTIIIMIGDDESPNPSNTVFCPEYEFALNLQAITAVGWMLFHWSMESCCTSLRSLQFSAS